MFIERESSKRSLLAPAERNEIRSCDAAGNIAPRGARVVFMVVSKTSASLEPEPCLVLSRFPQALGDQRNITVESFWFESDRAFLFSAHVGRSSRAPLPLVRRGSFPPVSTVEKTLHEVKRSCDSYPYSAASLPRTGISPCSRFVFRQGPRRHRPSTSRLMKI
jgi:hypothetical protein